jgi:hypothetical protein
VVILSSHSLFIEGVASRLRQYPQRVDVQFVDPQQPDFIPQIKSIRPAVILVHSTDPEDEQPRLFCDLLTVLSNVTIIRLGAKHKEAQIVTSTKRKINEVRDIIDIAEQSAKMLG